MFTVIGVMLGGIAVGSLLRRQEFSWIGKVITCLIWVLLFCWESRWEVTAGLWKDYPHWEEKLLSLR